MSKAGLFFAVPAFLLSLSSYSQKPELISFIEHYSDSILTTAGQPGMIISITCGDKIIYEKAKGYSDIVTKEPMDSKMRFRIGSLTKTFTATISLQLVDEGKLKLDDKVSKFFRGFPNGDNITVRMLGDMSSGIYNYSEAKEFDDIMKAEPKKKWKPSELVDIGAKNAVYFEPGKGWHYSNTNTVMLGMIIEQLTGNSLGSEIKIRIIDKLGLGETEFPTGPEIFGYHPHGYNEDDALFLLPLEDVTEKYDPSWGWAAGAMISSIADLKTYLKALAEGNLTSSEMHAERMKWALDTPSLKYGFGIFKAGDDFLGHNGSYPGFHNISVYSPKSKCAAIIFYNSQTNRNPDEFLKAILPLMK